MNISLSNIGKKYGKHWVFREISTSFEAGNIYPIIGGNGSGKSTLLQVVSGFITPNEGNVIYSHNGTDIPVEAWYKHIAMATPYLDLFEEFNVDETILLHGKLKALSRTQEEILEAIELEAHRHKPLKTLSSGMKQRVKLALAIYSSTPILLLDEPTSNLDAKWTKWFQEAVESQRLNRTIILCTNSNAEELAICDQAALALTH